MKRFIVITGLAAAIAMPALAQQPEGWKVRVDQSTNASDPDAAGDVTFTTIPGGYHAVNPSAAIYWNPANTVTGTYTVKATFKLMEPSNHINYYGLIFGGSALDGLEETYLYFLVAQDGTFLVKRRLGDRMPDPNAPSRGRRGRGGGPEAITEDIVAKTAHEAVRRPGADGTSDNTLEVRVGTDAIAYVVNGTVVTTTPRSGSTAVTDGIVGLRVNHVLNVQITGFEITR